MPWRRKFSGACLTIARQSIDDDVEQQLRSTALRQRSGDGEFRLQEPTGRRGNVTFQGHGAVARLVSIYATVMCRHAEPSTNIAAEFQRRHAGGQRRCRPARRSSDSTVEVPGIARQTKQCVTGLMVPAPAGTLVLPKITAPLRRILAIATASCAGL